MAIHVPIISSFDGKGITKALRDFKKLEGGSQKAAFGLLNADAAARKGVAAFAKFGAIGAGVAGVIGGKLVSAAYESQKVMKQTEAIVKATGGAARLTAQQVADLSEKLSMQVGVDDELIQSSANLLLTFKQVQNQTGENNKIFDRALQAALDLGNVFGSTDAAAVQLGKALSDPEKGITALRRAGINFTEQQKDQIKVLVDSGRTLDAQKLILQEVESQVGGTAAASATGFDRMRIALDNVAERLGELLLPYFEKFSSFVLTSVVPVLTQFTALIGERGVGAGFEFLIGKIIGAISGMGTLGKVIFGLTAGFAALRLATITYSATMGALNVVTTLSSGALSTLITRLGAARLAMLAAGGITALLGIAAVAYGIYAKKKSDATTKTLEFAEALKLEGQAQTDALVKLYKTDAAFKENIDTLTKFNFNLQDFEHYLETGAGALTDLERAGGKYLDMGVNINKIVTSGSDAISKQTVAFFNLRKEVPQLKNATDEQILEFLRLVDTMRVMRAETVQTQTALGTITKSLGTTGTEGVSPLDAELQKLLDDLKNTDTTTEKLGKTVKTAQERFREYVSALKGYGSDQKSYTSAIKDTTKAKKKLEEATNGVAVAQARYDQIVRGYGAGSDQAKAAQEALEQAQRDATRAGYDSERATFAVTSAEKELADLRADSESTSQQIREAEIALAEARLTQTEQAIALKEANDAVTTAQQALNEVINGASTSSQTYKDALTELNDAKADEAAAAETVAEAIDREAEAKLRLAEAERELDAARKGTSAQQRATAESRTGIDDKTVSGKRREFLDTVNKQFGEKWKSINAYINSGKTATSKANRKARFNEFARANNIPEMAKGGIVSSPTLALIGERGPEAVVPLSASNTPVASGDTYIININSKIADETLPDLLVAELRKFNRRSGAINIQVA